VPSILLSLLFDLDFDFANEKHATLSFLPRKKLSNNSFYQRKNYKFTAFANENHKKFVF
jgi:hypothetical protein